MFSLRSIVSHFPKRIFTSFVLISIAFLASASMGGGGTSKSKTKPVKGSEFVPIRTTNGFTLKSGLAYHGSLIFDQQKTSNVISFNSVVTYQRGNTTYILPYRYKMQTNSFDSKSSMQLLNLRIPIHK